MINILLYSFLYAIFNVSGATIIKSKLMLVDLTTFRAFIVFLLDWKIVLAIFLIFISMFFSIKTLSIDKFSVIIPILTGVNFLVTIIVGYLLFKDTLILTSYIGILFIILGIYMIGLAN